MLDGKVAIVTGSGRGIGAASAKKLGAEGASVVVSDIDPTPAEETVGAIRKAGGRAIAVVGDVTDPALTIRYSVLNSALDREETPNLQVGGLLFPRWFSVLTHLYEVLFGSVSR